MYIYIYIYIYRYTYVHIYHMIYYVHDYVNRTSIIVMSLRSVTTGLWCHAEFMMSSI